LPTMLTKPALCTCFGASMFLFLIVLLFVVFLCNVTLITLYQEGGGASRNPLS
jgi:hypothetical protein